LRISQLANDFRMLGGTSRRLTLAAARQPGIVRAGNQ
jgi:hypothetical protein